MPDVTSVGGSFNGALTSSATAGNETLGREAFLQLLVAQLQNQDPLNPQDNSEFVAQLAQYSSLEQQMNSNELLEKMVASSADMERMSAMNLIGKSVAGASDSFELESSGDAALIDRLGYDPGSLNGTLGYTLGASADEVTINILNDRNQLVASLPGVSRAEGEHAIQWDGKDQDGTALPAGYYKIEVAAKKYGSEGDIPVDATSYVMSTVTGVEFGASGSMLATGAGLVPLADVTNVGG